MNSREHLAEDLETLIKRTKQIGWVAWSVAIAVMIYGTPIVYAFLTAHEVPGKIAWLLSLAADGAVIVGLIATPVLAALNLTAGWVGALRWIAGFTTWALQTAGSWTHAGGVDAVGVAAHSFGPLLLFASVEAAASFQRKVATAITAKTRELAAAEQKDADRRAHLAETEAALRTAQAELAAVTSERDSHLRKIEHLTAEVTSVADASASEADQLRASIKTIRGDMESLRDTYETRLRETSVVHAEEIRALRQQHSEKLRQVRAEASTISLDAHRKSHTGGGKVTSAKATTKPRLSDEDAVQMLLDAPADLAKGVPSGDLREWNQSAIVDHLSIGWGRAPRLLEAVTEAQQRLAAEARSGDQAVGE